MIFFLLLQALQVIYKWNQEREAKENQETSKFLFVGKLDFDVFPNAMIFLYGC